MILSAARRSVPRSAEQAKLSKCGCRAKCRRHRKSYMEMIGGSSVSYLARTPCVPLFSATLFNRGGNRRVFRLPGEGGDHFHCTVEPSPGHIRCRDSGKGLGGKLGEIFWTSVLRWPGRKFPTNTPHNFLWLKSQKLISVFFRALGGLTESHPPHDDLMALFD